MADPAAETAEPRHPQRPPPPSLGSRYFFLFLVGLFVGAMAVVMVLRAVEGRKTWQDRFPHAAMQVMSAHVAQLKGSVAANRCAAADVVPHVQALRMLANDVEPAFPAMRDDERFAQHASGMRATLDRLLATPPGECAGAQETIDRIDEGCRACHQDFRG